jgi:hypothetical protein
MKRQRTAPSNLPEATKAFFQALSEATHTRTTFHPRRSLDQYYFSHLPDTTPRDQDQIVSKHTKKSPTGEKMIMVDQLWLWIVCPNEKDSSASNDTVVFTCFPTKQQESKYDTNYTIADLRQAILDEAKETWSADSTKMDAIALAALIVKNAVEIMFNVRNEKSLDFLEIFREAIGEAVSASVMFYLLFHGSDLLVLYRQNRKPIFSETSKMVFMTMLGQVGVAPNWTKRHKKWNLF